MIPTATTLTHTQALIPILGCVVLCVLCGSVDKWLRRRDWRFVLADWSTGLSVALIPATTLFRGLGSLSFSAAGATHWASAGLQRFVDTVGFDREITLNILLCVPAGVALLLRFRRPLAVIGFLSLMSVVIELTQGVLGLGNPDASDVLSNTLGALIGAAGAGGALWVLRRARLGIRVFTAAVLAGVIALAAGATPLANWRLLRVERSLRDRFAGTTIENYRRWSDDGVLNQRVFGVTGVFSDGAVTTGSTAMVRFPVDTLGVRRCVVARWTSDGFMAERASGRSCSDFMG